MLISYVIDFMNKIDMLHLLHADYLHTEAYSRWGVLNTLSLIRGERDVTLQFP